MKFKPKTPVVLKEGFKSKEIEEAYRKAWKDMHNYYMKKYNINDDEPSKEHKGTDKED